MPARTLKEILEGPDGYGWLCFTPAEHEMFRKWVAEGKDPAKFDFECHIKSAEVGEEERPA